MGSSHFKNGAYQKTVLKNGLRVITEKMPSVRSLSIGVWIDVGSRNEKAHENGLSHFIEHMVFKGTKNRNVKQIAASLESLGGALNGFTSREHTCFVARVLDDFLEAAVDVLADLSCNAVFAPANIRREGMVICEEIKESLDNPTERVHDLFSETFWGNDPLGQPIMGNCEIISNMSRHLMLDFYRRYYVSRAVVIAASGAISHQHLLKLVKEKFYFSEQPPLSEAPARRSKENQIHLVRDKNQQTHMCLGFPGIAYTDPWKISAQALNSYLGDGMSSVLFQKIREEKGLAYSVYSYNDIYRDCGIFGIYLGTDDKMLEQAFDIIMKELNRVRKKRITSAELAQVKAQMRGHLILSHESPTGRMNRIARQELMEGTYHSLKKIIHKINQVTEKDILEAANLILDESKMAVTILGPVKKEAIRNVG